MFAPVIFPLKESMDEVRNSVVFFSESPFYFVVFDFLFNSADGDFLFIKPILLY